MPPSSAHTHQNSQGSIPEPAEDALGGGVGGGRKKHRKRNYGVVRAPALQERASRIGESVSMVPLPNKLIKTLMKNRALSCLGLT